MNAFHEVTFSPLGVFLRLAAMLLVLGQVTLLMLILRQRRSGGVVLCAVLHLVLGMAFLTLLLDGAYRLEYLPYARAYLPPVEALVRLAWLFTAGWELVDGALLGLAGADAYRYARRHPTAQSIKEAVDQLPTGLCISDPGGNVLLSNRTMNQWNLLLTGGTLSNAALLRRAVRERGQVQEGKRLVRLPDGRALQFAEETLALDGNEYLQLSAEDVTEQYRVTKALEEENARLRELQYRLKAFRVRETELLMRQELLSARTTVHNELGGALLTGKYLLEHPESAEPEPLHRMLRQLDRWLLAETDDPEPRGDALDSALALAEGIGVRVELSGPTPEEARLRALLAQAVMECASNTVKHAAGDRLRVSLDERGFTITNNGKAPEREIVPTGGLRSLQLTAERMGGVMKLQSLPRFQLSVEI